MKNLTPERAIKVHCKSCCGDQMVKDCEIPSCVLYPFREGKNPFRKKRILSDAQRELLRARGFQKKYTVIACEKKRVTQR